MASRRIAASSARRVGALLLLAIGTVRGQARVGPDSATRWTRFGRDAAFGTAEGLVFAGVAQMNRRPAEWGIGWRGYEKRAASNLGEFYIQEGVTEGLASAMNRPLDYVVCPCTDFGGRLFWAVRGALMDQLPSGRHPISVPRIAGVYAGSFAQASWLPNHQSRARVALVNGTTSLGIRAALNLVHELRR